MKENNMYGYTGKMLFVNLDDGSFEERELTEELAKNFMGGPALGAKILYDEMPAHADPFSSESMIGFVGGPVNNTKTFFSGRYTVVSKSPVTNGFNDANSGGYFAPELKRAGFDAVFVKGIAKSPVYLLIDNGKYCLKDASALWGKTSGETQKLLEEELGKKNLRACYVGPAGERRSHIAAVMNDVHRAAGRGGSGAIMGSKNLKAIVVMGNGKIECFDDEEVKKINKDVSYNITEGSAAASAKNFSAGGTGNLYAMGVPRNYTGIKNWRGVPEDMDLEEALKASSPKMDPLYKVKPYGCANCPLHCGAEYDISKTRYGVKELVGRPEYETIGYFGSMLLNYDVESIIYCNYLCNEYGFDVISAGGTISWAMECFENGVFTEEDLDGIHLSWGNYEAIVAILEKMGKGEGVGAILQNGSYYASKVMGKGSEKYLVVANGIEPGQHRVTLSPGVGRVFKYDPTPGRHTKGGLPYMTPLKVPESETGPEDKRYVAIQEFVNACGMCLFLKNGGYGIIGGLELRYVNAVTGWNWSVEDQNTFGARSMNMRNAFNVREGIRKDDLFMSKELEGSPQGDFHIDVDAMGESFIKEMGWDEQMVPLRETLESLGGLDNVIRDIYGE